MIVVSLADDYGELGRIKIEKVADLPDDEADYAVHFAVERAGAVGLHQRGIYRFPRTTVNILGLLLAALNTLDESELVLEDGTDSSDLARRQRGTLPALQGGESGLHHHRSPFWRRQSEQHGSDG